MDTQSTILEFGDLELDRQEFELRCGGRVIKLEPRALEFLLFLAERAGSLVRTEELLLGVWEGVAVSRSAVHYCVVQARRAIGDDTRSLLQTVRGRGYRFDARVTRRLGSRRNPTGISLGNAGNGCCDPLAFAMSTCAVASHSTSTAAGHPPLLSHDARREFTS